MGKFIIYGIGLIVIFIVWKLYDVFMSKGQANQIRRIKKNSSYATVLLDEYDVVYNSASPKSDNIFSKLFSHSSGIKQSEFKINYVHEVSRDTVIFFTEYRFKDFATVGARNMDIDRVNFMVFIAKYYQEKNEIKVTSSTFDDNSDKSVKIQISRIILNSIVESIDKNSI